MKRLALFVFLTVFATAALCADDQVQAVQQQLKNQGFYYGQVDGQPGAETTAAIRRFQIRNGLQVTGTLTQETLDSLNGAAGNSAPPATNNPPPLQPAPLEQTQPAATPAPDVNQSDREFLKQQQQQPQTAPPPPRTQTVTPPPPAPPDNSNVVAPPVNVPSQASVLEQQYSVLYAHTPYETAPVVLQQGTLKNAQYLLANRRFYSGTIDGIPGPATVRAITLFQGVAGLVQTGRLDLDTLAALRLLPNSPHPVVHREIVRPLLPPVILQPFYPPQGRVYRGVWVN